MALGDLFQLSKLTIDAFGDEAETEFFGSLKVQYNPETLSLRHEAVFQSGYQSGRLRYMHPRARTLNIALVFDGTNVGHLGVELLLPQPSVSDRVQEFLDICNGVAARRRDQAHLRLSWGAGVLGTAGFVCRLQSVDIRYGMFDRDGSPLRADLSAAFVEHLGSGAPASDAALDGLQARVVGVQQTLPQLCRAVYGTPAPYVAVAAANGLDRLRSPAPGRTLVFPPLGRLPK